MKIRHEKWLKLLGRIGWAAKAIIYALIGGLACKNGVQDDGSNASPQVPLFPKLTYQPSDLLHTARLHVTDLVS